MDKSQELRKILSKNIRKARVELHISQAKLAEFANISVPYMLDIEYCKTWVSDKTLYKIAKALNMEVYELLIPEKSEKSRKTGRENAILRKTAELVKSKKSQLRKNVSEAMDDLMLDIIKKYNE